jgi:hypothetical protein
MKDYVTYTLFTPKSIILSKCVTLIDNLSFKSEKILSITPQPVLFRKKNQKCVTSVTYVSYMLIQRSLNVTDMCHLSVTGVSRCFVKEKDSHSKRSSSIPA